MKCSEGENFSKGELQHFSNIELSPSAKLLNYGQENAMHLKMSVERMRMPSPSVEQFVEAVKVTVLSKERWVICYFSSVKNYLTE